MPRVPQLQSVVSSALSRSDLTAWIQLLRWNKPTGRLILLIPAGWSLWLAPTAPPSTTLVLWIVLGGVAISGAGCIANDLWDRRFDREVARTRNRPLAQGKLSLTSAFAALVLLLLLGLAVVLALPATSRLICLLLAVLALPPILLYPSAKRWLAYPQAVLALCWGFAVLIPWAASGASLQATWPLLGCWMATLLWTFGFDTVYAMADRPDDARLGLNSSALSLGHRAVRVVRICYALTGLCLAIAAWQGGLGWPFWPCWLLASFGMQRAAGELRSGQSQPMAIFGRHFQQQVWFGSLLLLGLILGRIG